MILSDGDILWFLGEGDLKIEPHPAILQPASVDLHLALTLLKVEAGWMDPYGPKQIVTPSTHEHVMDMDPGSKGYLLEPGGFILGSTLEYIELPRTLVGIITGKSSLARIGLQIESAGYVDPGWKGNLTLEIVNLGPLLIMLRPEMPICQIRFEPLYSSPLHLYGDPALDSHYQGSDGVIGARFHRRTVVVPEPYRVPTGTPSPDQ